MNEQKIPKFTPQIKLMSKVEKFVFHASVSYTEINGFVDLFFQQICAYKYALGHNIKIEI